MQKTYEVHGHSSPMKTPKKAASRDRMSVLVPSYDPEHVPNADENNLIDEQDESTEPPELNNLKLLSSRTCKQKRAGRPLKPLSHLGPVQRTRREKAWKKHFNNKASLKERIQFLKKHGVPPAGGRCTNCANRDKICLVYPPSYQRGNQRPHHRCVGCLETGVDCVSNHKSMYSCDRCFEKKIECVPSVSRSRSKSSSEYQNRENFARRPRQCLNCMVGGSRGRCIMPRHESTSTPTPAPVSRPTLNRLAYAAHTKQWYKTLPTYEQNRYKAERIQADGTLRAEGPCTRCVLLGVPCMVVRPGSKISEFTQPTRCASCIFPHKEDSQIVGRACNTAVGISHEKHNARISLYDAHAISSQWDGFERKATGSMLFLRPPSTGMLSEEESEDLNTHTEASRTVTPTFTKVATGVGLFSHPLEPSEVSEQLKRLDYLTYSLSSLLISSPEKSDLPLPLSPDNLDKLEKFCGFHQRDSSDIDIMTVLSALQRLFGVTDRQELSRRVRKLRLENLNFEDVFRAVVSMTLFELVFLKPSIEIQTFEDTLKGAFSECGFDPTTDILNRAVEHHFGGLLELPLGQAVRSPILKDLANELVLILSPLVMLLFIDSEMRPRTREKFHTNCALIVEAATRLHTEIEAKPTHPVEVFFIPAGHPLDKYYVEGQRPSDNRVALTVMLGVKAMDGSERPLVYSRAKAVSRISRY